MMISSSNDDNHTMYAQCNDNYRAGGVCVFVNSHLKHVFIEKQLKSADTLKLSIQIENYTMSFLLIYRLQFQPISLFLNEISELCRGLNCRNFVLLGDINIDIIKNTSISYEYISLLSSFGLECLLNSSTRISSNSLNSNFSSTCIDHIFARLVDEITMNINVHDVSITDHKMIENCILIQNNSDTSRKNQEEYYEHVNHSLLSTLLKGEDWLEVYQQQSAPHAFVSFHNIFETHIKLATTIRKISKKC